MNALHTQHPAADRTTTTTVARHDSRWHDQELLIIREIAKTLGKSLDPAFAIREMLHLLSEFLGLNRGRVLLRDETTGELLVRFAYGLTDQEMGRGRFRPGEGITGRVFASGQTAIVQDIDADSGYLARTVHRSRLPQETVSYIAVPVIFDGRTAGVLGVHRIRGRQRSLSDDMQVLGIVATLIGQVLLINEQVSRKTARLEHENRELKFALERTVPAHGIIGESARVRNALRQIEQVSQTDATVLLTGESGTGKEIFARALHVYSPRRDAPFIKINCGAIPENLFESELFGHEKGAFTGAVTAKPGRFEQADRGTLFLDEVGDLPTPMQVKLLRVLQERTIERVGGRREIPVDVRIVAATHQNLQQLVATGRFRHDLYYRLHVIPIELPALRDRPEDIPHLTRYFLGQINQTYQRNVALTPEALDRLVAHPWPGNIRQLRNVLERVSLLADSAQITDAAVAGVLAGESGSERNTPPAAPAPGDSGVRRYLSAHDISREQIESALLSQRGNKSRAAQALGLTLRQLNYRLQRMGLQAKNPVNKA
jgi:Nif-specific regulatory protein